MLLSFQLVTRNSQLVTCNSCLVISRQINNFLYLCLKFLIMPALQGWNLDVVFLGRNSSFMFLNLPEKCRGERVLCLRKAKHFYPWQSFFIQHLQDFLHYFSCHSSFNICEIMDSIWAIDVFLFFKATRFQRDLYTTIESQTLEPLAMRQCIAFYFLFHLFQVLSVTVS